MLKIFVRRPRFLAERKVLSDVHVLLQSLGALALTVGVAAKKTIKAEHRFDSLDLEASVMEPGAAISEAQALLFSRERVNIYV